MPDILFNTNDDVLDITLNRPQTGNLVTNEMGAEIIGAIAGLPAHIKLIRFRGAGANFCSGRQSPPIDRSQAKASDFRRHIAEPPLALYAAIKDAPVPTLAVVQGEALGVGCAIVTLCDLTLASDDAIFQVPELDHGIPPTLVMWALLQRIRKKPSLIWCCRAGK